MVMGTDWYCCLAEHFDWVIVTTLTSAHIPRNSTNKFHSLQHKMLAITLPTAVCSLNLFSLYSLQSPLSTPTSIILVPLRMNYEDAVLLTPPRWKHKVCEELRRFSKEFCTTGTERLKQSWKNVLIMKGNLWKNKLDFLKCLPLIYKQLITAVTAVS
jgi:hypothetical protein